MWEIRGHGRKRNGKGNTSLEITSELQLDVNPIIVQYQTANFLVTNEREDIIVCHIQRNISPYLPCKTTA